MKRAFFLLLLLSAEAYAAKPICFAHRGGGNGYVDNSLSAVKSAIDRKLSGVEIDVQTTKDGELILLHDPECSNGILLNEQSLQKIRTECKLPNGESIPTLDEVLALLKHTNTLIILDLKAKVTADQVRKILDSGIAPERFRLSAFYPEFLAKLPGLERWNTIPRYEHFRHPVFSKTKFHKSFHLFSALAFELFGNKDEVFSVWEVNYPVFLKMVISVNPEFVVTKIPEECQKN